MSLSNRIELLIGQWQESPKLQALLRVALERGDDVISAIENIQRMQNLDTAEGVWLDWLGVRLGVRRPSSARPADDPRWGIRGTEQSRPYDIAPFTGAEEHNQVFPLGDELFRRFLRARGVVLMADGTFADYIRAVRYIDADVVVIDHYDMSITVRTDVADVLMIADNIGCLPRVAGVFVKYEALTAWGFAGAGAPFDTALFRRRG